MLWTVLLLVSYGGHREQLSRKSINNRLMEAYNPSNRADVASPITLFSLWMATLILYVYYPDWMTYYTIPIPLLFRWIGVSLGIISIPLLAWTHRSLGKYFSTNLKIMEKHKLITSGPYNWIRHPMYTAEIVFMISMVLASSNWIVALPLFFNIAFLYLRVDREEAMMIEHFGDEYRKYISRTGRFLPPRRIKSKDKSI